MILERMAAQVAQVGRDERQHARDEVDKSITGFLYFSWELIIVGS